MPRNYAIDNRICLNGWWDFQPLTADAAVSDTVPEQGWLPGRYLVPSFWTKLSDAVREPGEKYFLDRKDLFKTPGAVKPETEFLFDAFGYPNEWSLSRRAWVRRSVDISELPAGERWFLEFEAVEPRPTLFVNGKNVAIHVHPTLPMTEDITDFLHTGSNEIALFIDDYERDDNGRIKTPAGSWNVEFHCGIWQDVHLVRRGAVRVEDVTIRTSVREHSVEIIWVLANAADRDAEVVINPGIHEWDSVSREARAESALRIEAFPITVPANGTVTHVVKLPWSDAKLWQPETPHLYILNTVVEGMESHCERFGFREVWIDGGDLMFNGYPLHLFSDWGHKLTPYCFTENWIRQWFGMIRDANMNHSRLHTHPHPQLILDLADEEGILITGEAGLHGSGGALAADSPEFWDAARDHIRRFVRRDKNHPCVILWSVENEMRWNPHTTRLLEENLPELRKLFNQLDPTRPAYHEGDSSLWNESEQEIISRHYYKACAGVGWWKGDQPLHSGEMSLYHYAGPNNTAHLAGDLAWSSFRVIDEAAALDTAWIIEAGRALGVCCFGPWNLSCLENLRMEKEFVQLNYSDYTIPGMKPLQVPPHSSEFSFWKADENGYTPNWSFAIQKQAFRPLAVLDLSRRSGYFTDNLFRRELVVVNDTPSDVRGCLSGTLLDAATGTVAASVEEDVLVGRGRRHALAVSLDLAACRPGRYVWRGQFTCSDTGETLDTWERPVAVAARGEAELSAAVRVAVFGPGSLRTALTDLGVTPTYVDSLEKLDPDEYPVLILEKNTVAAGSLQNRLVQAFCRAGGRVLVMEQVVSLFPGMRVEDKPLQTQFFRAPDHPVLSGLTEEDVAFWGDSPYPEQGGNAFVLSRAYRKDDGRHALCILDGDEGGFGQGGLDFAGLLELREGAGLVLACQLNITDKAAMIPAAARLLANLLRRLYDYRPAETPAPMTVNGATLAPERAGELIEHARAGQGVIVNQATPELLAAFGQGLGVELRPAKLSEPVYQAVRVADDPVLAGVSNEDTCGIETWTYCPPSNQNCTVGELFLAPLPGIEPLLETPTDSVLREFFVMNGRSEPLRAHTMSRFLYAEKPLRAVVLGRVRVGAGQILFNQFAVPADAPARERLARLGNRLEANLGAVPAGSALDGERVPESSARSKGYPEKLHILNVPDDPALYQKLTGSTRYNVEHIHNAPIFGVGEWQRDVACPQGELCAADFDFRYPVYAYMQVVSAVQRKDASSNLGVPNPEAFTFLDITGTGAVEVTVNAQTRERLVLSGETASISDIGLEQGCNHVLIRWEPTDRSAILRLRWRNIAGRPETMFCFG
jgi:beta-galactosidase